jgi:hypothetical protein
MEWKPEQAPHAMVINRMGKRVPLSMFDQDVNIGYLIENPPMMIPINAPKSEAYNRKEDK